MRRLDCSFRGDMKSPRRFPCFSDREGSQSERLGYGFFHETRREVSIDSKIDLNRSSMLQMFKSLCVSREFSHQEGEDYGETFIEEIVPIFMKTIEQP